MSTTEINTAAAVHANQKCACSHDRAMHFTFGKSPCTRCECKEFDVVFDRIVPEVAS